MMRNKMRIIILFALLAMPFCCWAAKFDGDAVFEKGRRAYESGEYSRALDLFALTIRRGENATQKNLAYYYQGLVLFEMGMYYSSYVSFRNVLLRADAKNRQVYEKAIKNAVIITDKLGMVDKIGGVLSKLPANLIPSSVADLGHFAVGSYHFYKNRDTEAAAELKSVHPESKFYLNSLFFLGILATKKKNYDEAVFYFKKILSQTYGKKSLFSVSELARLNLARAVYASGQIEQSIEIYSRFLSSSPHWLTVLFEASWPLMRVNDTTVSLGNLHTILSPFYREDLVGEGYILRATILFTLCKYEEMRQTLAQFFNLYDSIMQEMNAEKSRFGSPGAFYNAYISKEGLNRAFLNYAQRDQGIQKNMKVLEMLRDERSNISRFRQNYQMKRMGQLIDRAEKNVVDEIGLTLMKLHKRKLAELLEQREQANYLKVEIVTGEKELIEGQKGLPPKRVVDVQTSVASGYRFWPFYGEYWEDELGAYVYTTESSCVN